MLSDVYALRWVFPTMDVLPDWYAPRGESVTSERANHRASDVGPRLQEDARHGDHTQLVRRSDFEVCHVHPVQFLFYFRSIPVLVDDYYKINKRFTPGNSTKSLVYGRGVWNKSAHDVVRVVDLSLDRSSVEPFRKTRGKAHRARLITASAKSV